MQSAIVDQVATEPTERLDYVEVVAALLLGLATVAIGWSTYQAALWGGQQDEGYTESVRQANLAVDQLQAADTIRALDQSMFVSALTSGVCSEGSNRDDLACERLLANLSDEGKVAVDGSLVGSGDNPFDSATYLDVLYGPGEEAKQASQQFFEQAGEANNTGDNYELATTVLTAVLFFAGIAAVLDDARVGWALHAVAAVLLIVASGYVISLPLA